jgi:hypothetical protein
MKLKASGKVTEFEFGKHYNTAELYNFEKLDQKGYFGKFSVVNLPLSKPRKKSCFNLMFLLLP